MKRKENNETRSVSELVDITPLVAQNAKQSKTKISIGVTQSVASKNSIACHRAIVDYRTADGLMQLLSPKVMAFVARNAEEIYRRITKQTTLKGTAEAFGEKPLNLWIRLLLLDTVRYTGIAMSEADMQRLDDTATAIQTAAPYIAPEEVLVFLQHFKDGRYERFYGTFNPQVLMQSLQTYLKERQTEIQRLDREQQKEHLMQQAAEAKANAITREQWEAIKREQQRDEIAG